jgi:DNA-binding IclR family transcriptional regulator
MGKAFLSELSEKELDDFYPNENLQPLTDKTIRLKSRLKADLDQIRKVGVAFAYEEGYEAIIGVAALIRGANGDTLAGISITPPTFRTNRNRTAKLAQLVKAATGLISSRLGYHDPLHTVETIEDIRKMWNEAKGEEDTV